MIHFDLPKQKSSIIKVLGVGGGGSNAVNFMFAQNIEGVDFIICNTDAKAIEQSKVPNKIQLGPHLTQGLGAGANPEIGKQATEESLEEIKRILEVNTKMAFITAGMGGGTGTGGAPIIAKICKELGILTVGIVTTPFGFEGPRRHAQAQAGIEALKPFVDTLLVISNDKLRMQFGNLKMKEAFGKADNVLATAAKCITDIINSRGHIIVDFADVCTVMKNGGVAILGNAAVEGEDRAQRAIEEALNSPLLNDNDIKGAKWLLLNINSAEGEHECTMDELEIINNYLRMQTGEETDVIMGMGYDNTLDKKIGITLIATGFQHKDPFKQEAFKKELPKVEKVMMTLNLPEVEKKEEAPKAQTTLFEENPLTPRLLVEEGETSSEISTNTPQSVNEIVEEREESVILQFELSTDVTAPTTNQVTAQSSSENNNNNSTPRSGLLSKPSNIYAEPEYGKPAVPNSMETQKVQNEPSSEEPVFEMKLVEKPETPETADSANAQANSGHYKSVEEPAMQDDAEELKRKTAERIQKLRNLSYTVNAADPNNEFETIPAYIRRNMELFGSTLTSAEQFYSKYTVKTDENNQSQISTINTFLDGKKPD